MIGSMATDPRTVAFIVDQAGGAERGVSARPMFGEYGLYLDGKMVALVCDDLLFVKPTPAGRAYAADAGEGSPYPGAKPHLQIDVDRLDEPDWLAELIRITDGELPAPKPRKPRAAKRP